MRARKELITSIEAPPPEIVAPDALDTRLGRLEFVNGAPTDDTVERVYENLDFTHAQECSVAWKAIANRSLPLSADAEARQEPICGSGIGLGSRVTWL